RFAFDTAEDLLPIVPNVEKQVPGFMKGVQPYPAELFRKDLHRVTDGRTDPELSEVLIGKSYDTVKWVADQGIPMEAAVSLSAIKVGDTVKWSPGAVIRSKHEGVGLSKHWFEIAAERKIELRYETAATQLRMDAKGRVTGVVTEGPDGVETIGARAVILGCGGFEANAEWRARYLGAPWDHAKVRGTPFNTGDGLKMAMDAGALPYGQWTGCHSTPIDANAPAYGDRKLTDKTNRLSYPWGVMINQEGKRFVDEGEDFQFYTYAKYGGVCLNEPGGVGWQIFDGKVLHLLEGRYKTGTPFKADTLDALIDQLPVNRAAAKKALADYNAAAHGRGFDPTVLDACDTPGLALPKSHWAQKLDTPPFVAYSATGGITFTFGGVRISKQAEIINLRWKPIPGLFACGEMVGGLFHGNYPGGTGLMSGAVFGKIAGESAAKFAAGA
ncbi:MAG TPA: FAD-dependent tricarballylate dehydrogenase TcuA, partial [bacterium]